MTGLRQRVRRAEAEDGMVSVWVAMVLPGLLAFFITALLLWSGYAARQHLTQLAEASARSGANAIDEDQFNLTGAVRIDPVLARQYATETLLLQPDRDLVTGGSIDVDTDTVTVVLEGRVPLFGGVIRGEASAEPRVDR